MRDIHPFSTVYPVMGHGGLEPISASTAEGGVTLDKSSVDHRAEI